MDYLYSVTPIAQNSDFDLISPFIIQSQDTFLAEGLGSSFYDHLKDAVKNNTVTQTEESFLRDYVMQMVAQYTFYLCYPFLAIKTTNKSVSKESSEYSQPAELGEVKYMRQNILDIAEFYKRRMIKHLLDHQNLYPTYANPSPLENLPKSSQSYFTGIYIPRSNSGLMNRKTWVEPFGGSSPCGGGGWCNGTIN